MCCGGERINAKEFPLYCVSGNALSSRLLSVFHRERVIEPFQRHKTFVTSLFFSGR